MTGAPEPTVIIPLLRCWRSWRREKHEPHLIGPNDDARRCDGEPIQTER